MSPQVVDEETPLLRSQQAKLKSTPLPWFQLLIVLFLRLTEPLASQVIYPFAPQLIRDIEITHGNESKVGYYVGLMQSLFYLTEAMTVLYWSQMSDKVGRKPVILIGLFGLSLSMYCFGLSKTFWGLVLSMVAEMTDTTNIAQAYAYMPIAWSSGATIGPIIGGLLSRPAERFPNIFGDNEFLKKYPYFLPCAVPATFTAIIWTVAFFFLHETVKTPVPISRLLTIRKNKENQDNVIGSQLAPTNPEKSTPLRSLLTRRVILAAGNYAFLVLVDISFRAVQPLFFATPIALGGLGLPPSAIGKILSTYGVMSGLFQVFFFPRIHDRWGSKKVFLAGIISLLPAFIAFPIMSYLAKSQGLSAFVWAVVAFQTVVSIGISLSYGAIFIFIAAAPPKREMLGATNGLSQMSVSLIGAIGPAAANSLFSLTIEKHLLGGHLVYYALVAVGCVSIFVGSLLPQQIWNR